MQRTSILVVFLSPFQLEFPITYLIGKYIFFFFFFFNLEIIATFILKRERVVSMFSITEKESLILCANIFSMPLFLISWVQSEPSVQGLREYGNRGLPGGRVAGCGLRGQPPGIQLWLCLLLSGKMPSYKMKLTTITHRIFTPEFNK